MKVLTRSNDYESRFDDVQKAKEHYSIDVKEFPELAEFEQDLTNAETLEEVAVVLNKWTDYFDGAGYKVKEF